MRLREIREEWEVKNLSRFACLSVNSQGRDYPEEECEVRTAFGRDRDRILHSKAFRRLKSKTQVFIAPAGDHYRTRLTHTLEVSQISRTVARALGLNEDLTEAIALGHDLGHTPFGHAGETALQLLVGSFNHNEQSLRVVEYLEERSPNYPGLNLTKEVREGIIGHTGKVVPTTLEGQVVRICDRVAYLSHDIEDAIRGGILSPTDIPQKLREILGNSHSDRIGTMVKDLITHSFDKPVVSFSEPIKQVVDELREFLFQKVYIGSEAKLEENKVYNVVRMFFEYYLSHPGELEERVGHPLEPHERKNAVVDYIAGMTDSFAMSEFQRLFLPQGWNRH
ncbi:MAG: deoxyguanosinetriphosphate triphosphohydrolase [Firmicutes bacterium]|nr:deoxyguanosinetriphosphate triphosphohydrolase [Bacillota bacterium]